MKISIPIADDNTHLVTTNVVDSTQLFDNLTSNPTYFPFYYEGFRYQHEGEIYVNAGDAISIEIFDYQKYLDGGYSLGDIVWSNKILKFKPGTVPMPPDQYTLPAPTESWDEGLWTSRYAKLQDVPASYGAIKTNRYTDTYGSKFSPNGMHYYECTITQIYHWQLSSPYDISSVGGLGTQTSVYTVVGLVGGLEDIFIHPNGTRLYYIMAKEATLQNYICQIDLGTAYRVNTANESTKVTKQISASLLRKVIGLYFSSDGTKFYIAGRVDVGGDIFRPDIIQVPTPAWDITSYGGTIYRLYTEMYSYFNTGRYDNQQCTTLAFNSTGTILYAWITRNDGLKAIYQFNLTSAWNVYAIDSINNIHFKRTEEWVLTFLKVPDGFWTCAGTTMRHYTTVNGDDILEAMHSPYNHSYTWNVGWANVWFEYRIATIAGVTKSEFRIYDELIRQEYMNGSQYYNNPVNIYSELTNSSTDIPAVTETFWNGWVGFTFVCYSEGLYVRTHLLDLPMETVDSGDIWTYPVESPTEIDGFVYFEVANQYKPFDRKNYTAAKYPTEMTYTVRATEPFDTLALGNVKAEQATIVFRNADGVIVKTIDTPVDAKRDTHDHLALWNTTLIFYSSNDSEVLYEDSSVEITLTISDDYAGRPRDVELATIMLGMSAEAGFTNLELQNTYKDFSNFEYDTWGNALYTERAKVSRYTGTVDVRIENYDMTDRLMTSLGANLVIVNGSDQGSEYADSETIFAATQKIGRFTSFNQKTQIADADMDVMATYSFTLEEIV